MWKPILIYSTVFVVLFVSHIIAAANDLALIFQIIALLITIQTMFAGYILHLLKGNIRHARAPVIALSAGLGWAYADMSVHWSIAVWVTSAILIHILTEKGLKYISPVEATDG